MKIVGLLSGGKDSVYNLCHCVKQGHEVVALASLRPPQGKEEIDSYMYQTVGQDGVHLIAEAMELPLYRRTIKGKAVSQKSEYGNAINGDETEDLYALLSQVLAEHPDVQGVSVGAILSNYQRVRVEHICSRLKWTSLAYLWQRDQTTLLQEMQMANMDCAIIKVAGAGLTVKHLGQNVASSAMQATLSRLHQRFGLHPCGEGGEYETFTVDCPLFKRKIELTETEVVLLSPPEADQYSIVAYLRIKKARLIEKEAPASDWLDDITIPPLLDKDYQHSEQGLPALTPLSIGEERNNLTSLSTHLSTPFIMAQDLRLGVLEQARFCLKQVIDGGPIDELLHINVYLSSMLDFALLNQAFLEVFGSCPPTRACVGVRLPKDVLVQMDVLRQAGCRKTMHVQSISYWAPANIGPYSQANLSDTRMLIAGQIGLIPATLALPIPQSFEQEMKLSLQHANRVQQAACEMHHRTIKKVEGAICWLVCEDQEWNERKNAVNNLWVGKNGFETPLIICRCSELPKGALVEWQITVALESPERNEETEGTALNRNTTEDVCFSFDEPLSNVPAWQNIRVFAKTEDIHGEAGLINVRGLAKGSEDVNTATLCL